MKQIELNLIPEKITEGKLDRREAVNLIGSFITLNYKVFGLQKYDEDFRSDIILSFLERGETFLIHYNKTLGDFFTYLYCYIISLARTKLRSVAQKKIIESIVYSESIKYLEDKEYKYNNIDYSFFDSPKVPYLYKKKNPESLKKIFSGIKRDKQLLVIAMKSVYYLTDEQINKICKIYSLNKDDFFKIIEYCKEKLLKKSEKKIKLQESRNYAYYHNKKYEKQLNLVEKSDSLSKNIVLKNHILEKRKKQYNNWSKLNNKLQKGLMFIRPTNKTVASILGICERQVTYYLNCAKRKYNNNNTTEDKLVK